MLFLRHGDTNYTGKFPDLTDKGKQEIGAAADIIADIIKGCTDIQIKSSPSPRALGTADIIAKRLGKEDVVVIREPAIRSMDIYDKAAKSDIWESSIKIYGDYISAYMKDPRFEEGTAIEARTAIRQRFFAYLGALFEQFTASELPDVMIHTSHFEVLWHLVTMIDGGDPLKHGEIIRLDISRSEEIQVQVSFRQSIQNYSCRVLTDLFKDHFKKA